MFDGYDESAVFCQLHFQSPFKRCTCIDGYNPVNAHPTTGIVEKCVKENSANEVLSVISQAIFGDSIVKLEEPSSLQTLQKFPTNASGLEFCGRQVSWNLKTVFSHSCFVKPLVIWWYVKQIDKVPNHPKSKNRFGYCYCWLMLLVLLFTTAIVLTGYHRDMKRLCKNSFSKNATLFIEIAFIL